MFVIPASESEPAVGDKSSLPSQVLPVLSFWLSFDLIRGPTIAASSATLEDGEAVDTEVVEVVEEPGRGATEIATSTVLLYAGYPSHSL